MTFRGFLVETGHISLNGVAANTYVYSDTIDVSQLGNGYFNLWTQIHGDTGETGATVAITWDGCYTKSGASYVTPTGASDINSGTSVSGPLSNGIDASSFTPDVFPFMRIKALHNGSATTATAGVTWALVAR